MALVIGAKLEFIMVQLAFETTSTTVWEPGTGKARDNLFWFRKPELLLVFLHYILFQVGHYVPISLRQYVTMSTSHGPDLSLCHCFNGSLCHCFSRLLCHCVTVSLCHDGSPSHGHDGRALHGQAVVGLACPLCKLWL